MATRRPFVGGNHKMNGTKESLTALLKHLTGASLEVSGVEVIVAPPTILVRDAACVRACECRSPSLAMVWRTRFR